MTFVAIILGLGLVLQRYYYRKQLAAAGLEKIPPTYGPTQTSSARQEPAFNPSATASASQLGDLDYDANA